MSLFPNQDPVEYDTLSVDHDSLDGPDFPPRRRKPMSEVMIIYKIQELESSIEMHRRIQIKFDPLAHSQYWTRELALQDCQMRLAHARTDLSYCMTQRLVENSLDRLESYLKGINVIDRSLLEIISMVVQKASADMIGRGTSFEDSTERLAFHRLLQDGYNPSVTKVLGWCSVTQLFTVPSAVRATHIFPYWVGEHVAKLIFGNDFDIDTLFSTNNGLVVHESVAIALVNLWIVIVPTGPPRSGRWKTRVIKKDLLNRHMGCYRRRWVTVDNRELEFQGRHRPSARYLYWHYTTARIHASARQPAKFWADLMGKDCWEPREQYIRLDYLEAYVERRRDFKLENFDDLRKCAILVWSPGTWLDTRVAAKLMSDVMDSQHVLVTWHNAGPLVDEGDGYDGDKGGYGGDVEDAGGPVKEADANGRPAHVIGPNVTRPPPASPHTGPTNRDSLSTSTEEEVESERFDSNKEPNTVIASEDAENQDAPDVLQETHFPLNQVMEWPSLGLDDENLDVL